MRKYRLIAFSIAALATGAAVAHEGAMGVVAERMSVMKEMALSMKTVGEMLNGRKAFDADSAKASVAALHQNCHQARAQFSSGTPDRASRASSAVWENRMKLRRRWTSSMQQSRLWSRLRKPGILME